MSSATGNYGTLKSMDEKIRPMQTESTNIIDYPVIASQSRCCFRFKCGLPAWNLTCMLNKLRSKERCIHISKYFVRLFFFLIFFGISSMIGKVVTMVYVVPRVDIHAPPASDVLLDFFKHANPNAFKATEIMTGILTFILVIISLIHSKERFYILPRFLFISGTLINLRTLCISITTFSIPTRELTHSCSKLQSLPKQDLLWKSINLFEFSETCGDYVFSGHATALIVVAWFVWYYARTIRSSQSISSSSSTLNLSIILLKLMNLILICMVLIGCLCILLAKEHYSVDVVVGGVISVMWCSLYHLFIDIYRKQCLFKRMYHNNSNNSEDCECSHDIETNSISECLFVWFYLTEGPWYDSSDPQLE